MDKNAIARFLHLERCPKGVWMKANLSLLPIREVYKDKGKKGTTLMRSA